MTLSTGSRIVDFLVFSNLWVSASAGLLTYAVARITACDGSVDISLLIAGGTAMMYGFIRLFFYYTRNSETWNEAFKKYRFACWTTLVAGAFLTLFHINEATNMDFCVLLPAFVLTAFYPRKISKFHLRELPGLKIWMISAVWVLCCFAFPILHSAIPESPGWVIWSIMFGGFSLVLAATIPFDMRDLVQDSPRLRTIPQVLGIRKSQNLLLVVTSLSTLAVIISSAYVPEAIFLTAAHAGVFAGAMHLRNMTGPVTVPLIFEGSLMLPALLMIVKDLI